MPHETHEAAWGASHYLLDGNGQMMLTKAIKMEQLASPATGTRYETKQS
jgi:hypothetical protein